MFQSTAKLLLVVTALLVVLFSFSSAFAVDDAVTADKSFYNLFNPTPDNLLRSISTDRPGKTTSANTVDAGRYQIEADFLSWSLDRANASHVTSSSYLVADPTFKVGLTQNMDLEVALAPLNFNFTHDRNTGARNTSAGFGDVYTRLKYNLFGNDGGNYVLAVVPYVKAPTASHNVGNNHWEGGAYIPFQVNVGKWSIALMTELDILENAALNGFHTNYQNIVNMTHPVFSDKLSASVEFWSDVNNDQNAPVQYSLDFAGAWQMTDNLQWDAGINIGLNRATPDLQPYFGISERF